MRKILFYLFLIALPSFATTLPLHVFLVGAGGVGSQLIEQIEKNHERFHDQYGIDIRIVAIANSRRMVFNRGGVPLNNWRGALEQAEPMSWDSYLIRMISMDVPHKVFVDCTSNQNIADCYVSILENAISISTPNKKANSSRLKIYKKLQELSTGSKFFYDANVGAGLPMLSTIQSLQRSGDEIVKIEGIFSGTLSYLFNSFQEGTALSKIIKDAQNKGYTEPDPRDDLNGMDAARKLLIICREAGIPLEMEDIEIESFIPADCFEAPTVDDFYTALMSHDAYHTELGNKVQAMGKRFRYIASFENGKARLSLQAVGPHHPFYHLSGTDNIVAITTKYYHQNPLVIQGPGAGLELTAAKVLEGIVRIGLNPP